MLCRVLLCLGLLGPAISVAADRQNQRSDGTPGHRVLAADKGRVCLVDPAGKIEWEYANRAECHDLWLLDNGHVLLPLSRNKIAEVDRDRKIVWEYESKPLAANKAHVEIHAFQPLPEGRVMIAESGNR